MSYTIRRSTTPEDLAKCHEVRFKVFIDEQGYDAAIEVDDIDSQCLHWLAVDQSDQAVGTARLYKYSPTVGKVGRVAVLSSTRGSGLGRLLMEEIEKYVVENTEFEKLALSSQVPRKGFYEKVGFVAQGEVYLEEGQPHVFMEKKLTHKA
ncbi:hypothetical protein BX616_010848 [Lobosporangium transversale]|uniref:GCN5-related N-acetyltransferase n=1 Tax=Lobosporangium transversale TaxID=64571 RepID=A0A1Y2GJD2_9FUNG|nr:GCN5-related N-acetyltransferase [Lobosporangium transversale]KAF9910482.1 hypothetical protein BX616_010848 [Lobosporangium transversale]ORZ11375.1 GCN5-related N-acetyltransferase [Lobosporangium transversale]|eukprot:XP_021879690.1 GCN5-related N-acetyltransferase [Lobosporangium transversale]